MTTQPKILIADDQLAVRQLLEALFAGQGWDIRTAADGREALRHAETWRPDLALLDMRMPELDGLEVTAGLLARYPGLPILILTAVSDTERVKAALACGATDVVAKPFDVFALRERVAALLSQTKAGQ